MKRLFLVINLLLSMLILTSCDSADEVLVIDWSNELTIHYTINSENPLVSVGTDEWNTAPSNHFSKFIVWRNSEHPDQGQGGITAEIESALEDGVDVKAYFEIRWITSDLENIIVNNQKEPLRVFFTIAQMHEYAEAISEQLTAYVIEFDVILRVSPTLTA